MLHVISTDIKKSSSLWKINSDNMFQALQWHHAILRTCFAKCGFDVCSSSPEGDAFIASRVCEKKDALMCIKNIIYLMDKGRKDNKLKVSDNQEKNFLNKIHIRIGLSYGNNIKDDHSHTPSGLTDNGESCKKDENHTICSNKIVFESEQAEIECKGWTNHYCDFKDNKKTKICEIRKQSVTWQNVIENYTIPVKQMKKGLVLFLHPECESNDRYCGNIENSIEMTDVLVKRGWTSVKVKRDKTAMLVNINIKNDSEAKKEFDKIIGQTKLVVSCAYGMVNVILNKYKNVCNSVDAFGDTVNAAARMHNSLCFMEKPNNIKYEIKNRNELNLGTGQVYIYKCKMSNEQNRNSKRTQRLKF